MIPHDADSVVQRDALGHVDVPAPALRPYELLSHEVRTPLTVLLAGAEVLEQRLQDDELTMVVAAMQRAVRRIDRIVDGLSSAFGDSGSRSVARLSEVLDHVVDELSDQERARLDVVVDAPAASRQVPMSTVGAIVRELVGNAFKFSAACGRVELCADVTSGGLVVTVKDQGPGVAAAACEDVFAPFHQLDMRHAREHQGLGLGLYTARRIARALGGDVTMATTDDGAAVRLALPLQEPGD